jgi:hypothetical protein
MAGIDKLLRATLQNQNLSQGISSSVDEGSRNIFPAVVISNEDPLGMKRIIARIVDTVESFEDKSFLGGRDKDTPEEKLPFCVPMMPNHFHIIPIEGEMVYILLENPSDNKAPRYYMGAQINSPFKLKFQAYPEANRVFKNTEFNLNKSKDANLETAVTMPKVGDIAIQGRTDADLILRPREVFLVAGKFDKGTVNINKTSPSSLQLTQLENPEKNDKGEVLISKYSQGNVTSTNLNLYSARGKFRDNSISSFEINEDLKSFGDLANKLHPSVFGDELIKLLDLIINVLLNHIHTPQLPLLATPESDEISSYTIDGNLQRIISNHVRIN